MISRRNFTAGMVSACGLTASSALYADYDRSPNQSSMEDLLIGGGRYIDLDSEDERFVLSLTSPITGDPNLVPLDFYPHGITIRPSSHSQILAMEKKGPGCALVDIEAKEILTTFQASEGCWFYGHGVYSRNSANIYVVETDLDSSSGLISIRDAGTGQIVGRMETFGANPHDCILVDDGNVLSITNAGLDKHSTNISSSPCVTYLDAVTGKLLEKIPLTNIDINAGHLLVTEKMDLAVVSAPREGLPPTALGGISLKPNGKNMKTLSAPKEILGALKGETLSLAYHEQTDTLAATTPDANLVTFWRMREQSFISAASLPKPRGICLSSDGTHFQISAGEVPTLYSVDAQDLSKIELINQSSYISGSHLYNWTSITGSTLMNTRLR